MSTTERVDPLQAQTEGRTGVTYLLTTNDNGSPHAAIVKPSWEKGRLRADVGSHSERNIDHQPLVAFIWPPEEPGGYTLFVDADAVVLMDGSISARPVRGVLHRRGEPSSPDAECGSDCLALFPS